MNPRFFFVLLPLLLFGISFLSDAQSAPQSTISVTIQEPAGINASSALRMDPVNVNPKNFRTITLPANPEISSGSQAIQGPMDGTFTVTGDGRYSYEISLPEAPFLMTNGHQQLTITGIIARYTKLTGQPVGSDQLQIGATVHIGTGQAPGNYITAAPFPVTVNYY